MADSGCCLMVFARFRPAFYTRVFLAWRTGLWPGPSEVVDDHVLRIWPAGNAAVVERHGLTFRRLSGGRILKNSSINRPIYSKNLVSVA